MQSGGGWEVVPQNLTTPACRVGNKFKCVLSRSDLACSVMLCHALFCHALFCHALFSYVSVMLCSVVLCSVQFCHVRRRRRGAGHSGIIGTIWDLAAAVCRVCSVVLGVAGRSVLKI